MTLTTLPVLVALATCGCSSGDASPPTAISLAASLTAGHSQQGAAARRNLPGSFQLLGVMGEISTPGQVDTWPFDARAGDVVRVELLATRLDQEGWGSVNTPRIALLDLDGTTPLLSHGADCSWAFGRQDLEFPRFSVPATGTYSLSVSGLDSMQVGGSYALVATRLDLNVIEESEPNDVPGQAQPIQPGKSLHGFHSGTDDDLFSFTVAEESLVRFEVTAFRNGIADQELKHFDPVLQILDSSGAVVVGGNDDAFFFDSGLSYKLGSNAGPTTYLLRILGNEGSGAAPYFVDFRSRPVGDLSEDDSGPDNDDISRANAVALGDVISGLVGVDGDERDYFKFEAQAGDYIRIWTFDGDNAQGGAGRVDILLQDPSLQPMLTDANGPLHVVRAFIRDSGTHYLSVASSAPSPVLQTTAYSLRLARVFTAVPESEPNGDAANANPLTVLQRVAGVVSFAGDSDWFRFSISSPRLVRASIYAGHGLGSDGSFSLSGGSTLQPVLQIRDSSGVPIARSGAIPSAAAGVYAEGIVASLPTVGIAFMAPQAGDYFLEVLAASTSPDLQDQRYVAEIR